MHAQFPLRKFEEYHENAEQYIHFMLKIRLPFQFWRDEGRSCPVLGTA